MPPALPQLAGVEHRFLDLSTGVRVHLATAGPPDAPPLLLLHGWPQHWWSWREVVARLSGERRLLCPDLRGLGWSGWPQDGSFAKPRLADDAVALLDALGLERVCLAGHDWGGWTAILAALQAPGRFSALVAMSIGHPWQPPPRVLRNAWRLWYQLPLAAPLLGEALVRDGRFPRAVLESARGDGAGWAPGEVETYLAALPARASSRYYRDFLVREAPRALAGDFRGRRLTVPTLLLHGRRDPLGTELAEGLERHAASGRVELVDGAGHFLPEEAPDLVAERLRAMCG